MAIRIIKKTSTEITVKVVAKNVRDNSKMNKCLKINDKKVDKVRKGIENSNKESDKNNTTSLKATEVDLGVAVKEVAVAKAAKNTKKRCRKPK